MLRGLRDFAVAFTFHSAHETCSTEIGFPKPYSSFRLHPSSLFPRLFPRPTIRSTIGRMKFKKPPLRPQVTTLWDYPSQHYGDRVQGDPLYKGATPSYIIWNLLRRYTKEKELVVDCFAGSGTTLDVARDLNRRALGYDVHPTRKDIFRVDARKL